MRRPQLQPQLPLGRYSTLLHWPCPNKTSSYPKKAGETRARSSLSQRGNPTHSPLTFHTLSPSFSFLFFAYLSLSVFRSHCEGEPRAWAVPRTQQTLPGLIRLAWHDAFFPFLLCTPPLWHPLSPFHCDLVSCSTNAKKKFFFRHSPPSPGHCHCRSRSSLLNLKRCCSKEWEIAWGSGRRRATCQPKPEERDPARATAPAPAATLATATAPAPATHLKRVTSQELQQ